MTNITTRSSLRYLYINSRDELLRLDIDRVIYFKSNGNYTDICCANRSKYTVSMSLLRLQNLLVKILMRRANIFVRIGKNLIINTTYITHISVPRQRLLLSDLNSFDIELTVPKTALRNLKNILTTSSLRESDGEVNATAPDKV